MENKKIAHDPLVLLARRAAAAGAQVLAGRDEEKFNTDEKSAAGDWVTDFDRAAEEAIRATIFTARPNDELTGEEFPARSRAIPPATAGVLTHWMARQTSCGTSHITAPR